MEHEDEPIKYLALFKPGPKLIRRLIAKLYGYFWGPCPLCNRMFSSFEASPVMLIEGFESRVNWEAGVGHHLISREACVCNNCTHRADRENYRKFGITYISKSSRSVDVTAKLESLGSQSTS